MDKTTTFALTSDLNDYTNETSNTTYSPDAHKYALTYVNQVAYIITCIVGSIGNILVIFTIWRVNRLHTVMYLVLASLAKADLILCLFYLPFLIAELFNGEVWKWGNVMCKFVFYMHNLSCVVSILNLTAVSVERFLAVRYPLKSRQFLTMGNAKVLAAIIWIMGAVYGTPCFYGYGVHTHEREGVWVQNCYLILLPLGYKMWYLFYYFIPLFIIPLVIMTCCYSVIIYTIFSRKMPGEVGDGSNNHSMKNISQNGTIQEKNTLPLKVKMENTKKQKELKQLTAMLILVIVLFMLCWSPYFFMLVLISFTIIEYEVEAEKVFNFCSLLAIFNSAMNPLIYAFLSPTFRKAAILAITDLFQRGRKRSPKALNYTATITGAASIVNHKTHKTRN